MTGPVHFARSAFELRAQICEAWFYTLAESIESATNPNQSNYIGERHGR